MDEESLRQLIHDIKTDLAAARSVFVINDLSIIHLIPLGKLPQSLADPDLRLEAVVSLGTLVPDTTVVKR